MGGPPLPNLGDEITMSVVIGGGGGGGGGAEACGGAGGGHGGGGAVDSEEARLRALQKTAIALRSAVPKKSIFEGKKGKMRRRASELKASEAESAAQQAQHNFSTGGGGGVRAYPDGVGAAAAQQEGAGDFTRLQQRIGGLAAGLVDGGSTDYAPPAAPTPTVPPPMNMARLSLSPMDQTSIPAAPMLLDASVPPVLGAIVSGWVPTLNWRIDFKAHPSAGSGPLRFRFRTRRVTGGFLEEDGELWDGNGNLVALSRQLAMVGVSQARL